MIIKDPITY